MNKDKLLKRFSEYLYFNGIIEGEQTTKAIDNIKDFLKGESYYKEASYIYNKGEDTE